MTRVLASGDAPPASVVLPIRPERRPKIVFASRVVVGADQNRPASHLSDRLWSIRVSARDWPTEIRPAHPTTYPNIV